MKRIVAIILTVVLSVCLLTGCASEINEASTANGQNEGYSEAKLDQISKDWLKYNYKPLSWYHTDGFGCYYLGSDNGYDIFYYDVFIWPGNAMEYKPSEDELRQYGTTSISGHIFYPCSHNQLIVYKDGVFDELLITNIRGNISNKAVANAANSFNAYMEIIGNADAQEFWESEKTFWSQKLENWDRFCEEIYNATQFSDKDDKILQRQLSSLQFEIADYITKEESPKYNWYWSWFNGMPVE